VFWESVSHHGYGCMLEDQERFWKKISTFDREKSCFFKFIICKQNRVFERIKSCLSFIALFIVPQSRISASFGRHSNEHPFFNSLSAVQRVTPSYVILENIWCVFSLYFLSVETFQLAFLARVGKRLAESTVFKNDFIKCILPVFSSELYYHQYIYIYIVSFIFYHYKVFKHASITWPPKYYAD